MKEYQLKKIKLKSYVKLLSLGGLGMGIIFGILGFIVSLFDGESVYVTIGTETTTGIIAGLEMLIVAPIIMTFIFAIFSIFLYLGFSVIMKFKKTIQINMQISDKD